MFEIGIDRGVVYPRDEEGAKWTGLISVSQAPTGGTPTAYFVDGINHVNEVSREQFSGTIQAYTYPDVFSKCDGTEYEESGIYYEQQSRKEFDLTYRTLIGNDVESIDYGYKIHLIYNALASPTTREYGTISDSIEPSTFSWTIVTTPVRIPPKVPTSKLSIDSRKCDPEVLETLEDILYGKTTGIPRMPSMSEVITIFDDWEPLEIQYNPTTGISPMQYQGLKDLKGNTDDGFYTIPDTSRLQQTTSVSGMYIIT